jgi:hypothetical protein
MSNTQGPGEKKPAQLRNEGYSRGANNAKKSNTAAVVGISVGALVLVGIIAFVALGNKHEPPAKSGDSARSERPGKKKEKDAPSSGKSAWSSTPTPAAAPPPGVWAPGARALVDKQRADTNLVRDENLKQEYASLAGSGKTAEIVAQDHKWFLFILDGLLNDTEAVARGSMQALHDIIVKRNFGKEVLAYTQLATASKISGFESPQMRAEEYTYWSGWWYQRSSQEMVAKWANDAGATFNPSPSPSPTPVAVGSGEMDAIMGGLKAGGGFDQPTSPEYPYFQKLKSMGKSAYPKLVAYIDNEDPAMGRAAVAALNALTGRDSKLPNDATKSAIKAEWESWLKTQ